MTPERSFGLAVTRARGAGERVLWLHGYTLDASLWHRVWTHLPGLDHVAVDLPGHGVSRDERYPSDLRAFGERIANIVRSTGATHLVGMSFGALVATEAAMALGVTLESLTLVGAPLGGGPQDPDSIACNSDLTRLLRSRGIGPWLAARWLACPPQIFAGARRDPELFAEIQAVVERHAWRELEGGQIAALVRRVHSTRDLTAVRARTLLLTGSSEMEAFKRSAELLRRGIPNARTDRVFDAGHLCALERPELAAAKILLHIRGERRAPAYALER